ncbi:MAG: tetratricopeptide repeat protein [Sumerlaeia bacterium]
MAPTNHGNELALRINAELDPCAVIERIGYRVDRMRVLGTMIRTPCPIHHDDTPGTLIITPGRNIFKCMAKTCPAHRGGNLVDLWGLHVAKSGVDAAMDLARNLKLPFASADINTLPREVEQALAQRSVTAAEELVDHARVLLPQAWQVAFSEGRVAEARQKPLEAAASYREAARRAAELPDRPQAEKLLREEVLRLLPEDEDAMLALADLLALRDDRQGETEVLDRLVARKAEQEEFGTDLLMLLDRLTESRHGEETLLMYRARALAASGQTSKAGECFLQLAEMRRAHGAYRDALDAVEQARAVRDQFLDAWRAAADLHELMGLDEDAVSDWEMIAEMARNRQDRETREEALKELIRRQPARWSHHLELGEFHAEGANPSRAREVLCDAWRSAIGKKARDDARRLLAALCRVEGGPAAAHGLMEEGDHSRAAFNALLDVAEEAFAEGHGATGLAVCEEASKTLDAQASAHERIGTLLLENDHGAIGKPQMLRAAVLYLEHSQPGDARRCAQAVIDKEPAHREALRLKIRALLGLGETADAISVLEDLTATYPAWDKSTASEREELEGIWRELLELVPDHLEAMRGLARAAAKDPQRISEALSRWRIVAGKLSHRERREEKVQALEAILQLAPDSKDTLQDMARLLMELDRPIEAAAHYSALGAIALRDERLRAALTYYEEASRLNPANIKAVRAAMGAATVIGDPDCISRLARRLATLHLERGEGDRAEIVLRNAIEACEDDLSLPLRLSELLAKRGERPEAEALRWRLARKKLALDRPNEAADDALAALELSVMDGRIDDGRAEFRRLLSDFPDPLALRRQAAALFSEQNLPELAHRELMSATKGSLESNRLDEALECARELIDAAPGLPESHGLCAEVLQARGELEDASAEWMKKADLIEEIDSLEAARALENAIKCQPDDIFLHERLIAIHEAAGRTSDMVAGLRGLAEMQRNRGEFSAAALTLNRILSLSPDDTGTRADYIALRLQAHEEDVLQEDYLFMARLRSNQGRHDEAMKFLRKTLALDHANEEARRQLVGCLTQLNRLEEARRFAYGCAREDLREERPSSALNILTSVAAHAAEEADYHRLRARAHERLNEMHEAAWHLREGAALCARSGDAKGQADLLLYALRLDPSQTMLHREAIDLLSTLERSDDAIQQQIQLAFAFADKGQVERAEQELRAMVEKTPQNFAAWEALFDIHMRRGTEKDLIADYRTVARLRDRSGNKDKARHYYGRVRDLAPYDMESRRRFVDLHLEMGGEEVELVDDYLALADALIAAGRVDDGVALYGKVMSLDPQNSRARYGLTETSSPLSPPRKLIADDEVDPEAAETDVRPAHRPTALFDSTQSVPRLLPPPAPTPARSSPPQSSPPPPPPGFGASDFLANEVESMERDEQSDTLRSVIRNYRDIIAINPQNAQARVKLADLLVQTGQQDDANEELTFAADAFFRKGDMNQCVDICERVLDASPANQKVRLLLKQALNKRDAMKALESAILFSDKLEHRDEGGPRPHR